MAPNAIENGADRPGGCPDEVDIFGIPDGLGEMQFVERGAAAKPQLVFQEIIREKLDERAADDQVLLDLS